MKTLPPFRVVVLLALVMPLLWLSCRDNDNPSPQSSEPVVTEPGTPLGDKVSGSIGTTGGTLQSADGKLKITIPAGALSANTTVSVQPISNTAPLGLGHGYRLEPEGTTFAKPVTLTFTYTDDVLNGNLSDFLWIVTQGTDGGWNAALKSVVDDAAHTVTVEAPHFSDWALGTFVGLSLTPTSSTLLVGKSLALSITGFSADKADEEDELVPLSVINSDLDALTPLTPIPPLESRLQEFKIKSWTLNGTTAPVSNSNGSLTAEGKNATYTAPNKKPSVNPVAVSVQLQGSNKEGKSVAYMLNSNISIVSSDYYLLVTIDGVAYEYYQYGFNGTIPPDPENFSIANCGRDDGELTLGGGSYTQSGQHITNAFALTIAHPKEGDISLGCIHNDDDNNDDDDVEFIPGEQMLSYTLSYVQREKIKDACDITYKCASFEVTIGEYSGAAMSDVTGIFSGTLYEDLLTNANDCKSPKEHNVRGEFRLVVVN
ncbi:hypothetical protein [Chryseolinea lacunae]|uniref:ZU5 domain-containing protein n=1 Tax=Chryseolinea lacunae TaxID=2801331 RepID=A0ABS1KNM7_9BACT|nr:hypothetical protein [Chryseolinea lacunae]MBL0740933.1 hypothetical protein [Chryseolinea lacunae]